MGMLKNRAQPLEVGFNPLGQTDSGHSDQLSSYIGVIVREHIPITSEDWTKVDKNNKEDLWELIQVCLFI